MIISPLIVVLAKNLFYDNELLKVRNEAFSQAVLFYTKKQITQIFF
jgi:hypothetical protein